MPDLSRHRPYLVWGALIVAVGIMVTVLLIPGGAWVAFDERRSSLRTTPDGVAAWARSLEELGVPVDRRLVDFSASPPEAGGLTILQPLVGLSAGEVHVILEWVRGGGVLIYSPGFFRPLADSLGVTLSGPPQDPYVLQTYRDSLIRHPWTEEPRGWTSARPVRVQVETARPGERRWQPLTSDDFQGSSLGWLEMGEGGVLIVADAAELANGLLAESPIAVTVTRAVVDLMDGEPLVFSEYHQGMGDSRGLVRESIALAAGLPFGRILLHLGVTSALLLLLAGRRFGSPLPEPPGPRRSTVEHVDAVANIYRAGRSHGTVAHYLIRSAARRAKLPQAVESDEDALRTWRSRPGLEEPVERALGALASDPPDLTTLEAALDDVVKRHDVIHA